MVRRRGVIVQRSGEYRASGQISFGGQRATLMTLTAVICNSKREASVCHFVGYAYETRERYVGGPFHHEFATPRSGHMRHGKSAAWTE
jgi:hypothetical protein